MVEIVGSLRAPSGASCEALDDAAAPTHGDLRTRDRVCREILAAGPVTASDLGCRLGLSANAVRRHLDSLLAEDLVAVWEAPAGRPRGRGRPAREYVLTPRGHAILTSAYDDLAAAALTFLGEVAGAEAVEEFARRRGLALEARVRPSVVAAGEDLPARVAALADVLSQDGYAATTRPVALVGEALGTQLCQGHCPVQRVAADFPQLCEAETETFSRLLGVHVQRLATLAHGEHVCTTYVPHRPASERTTR